MYKCPFCGLYIKYGIDALNEHRYGGECDRIMDELKDELEESSGA